MRLYMMTIDKCRHLARIIVVVACLLPMPSKAAEDGFRIATWMTASMGGQYSNVPVYYLTPFLIGNPTNSTVIFDRVEFVFEFNEPMADEVTAQTLVFTKGKFPSAGRVLLQHFGRARPAPPTGAVLETLTLGPNVDLGIGDITLMPRISPPSGSPTRVKVNLYLGAKLVLQGGPVQLPPWKSLPQTRDLYAGGQEKQPGVRGEPLLIPLSVPTKSRT